MSAKSVKPNNANTDMIEYINDHVNVNEISLNDESVIEGNDLNNSFVSDAGDVEEYFVNFFNNNQAHNRNYS
ncbi:hypothetical protein [Cysteiniphilum sp. JM-1]|uniref:hypothetical protein n=1 Tax=Cysteiniphilum sp. JM-1 TaxID=2610891 RepID=UPI001247173B|nr:hypothetical protein [Cysteiniphilum sp. JM-1]